MHAELKKREGYKPQRGGHTNPAKREKNAATKAALPADVVPHLVPDEEQRCPHCGEDATQVGDGDVSVEYEWVPGYFRKRLHIMEVARCPCKPEGSPQNLSRFGILRWIVEYVCAFRPS